MAKGNDGSAARRRTTRKLLIAAGIALVLTFVIVSYGRDDSPKIINNSYSGYDERGGGHHHHKHHHNGGRDGHLPRGFQHTDEGGGDDDGSASLTSTGQDDRRHDFSGFKRDKKFKHGGYPDGFGARRDFGARGDDDGNGGGFLTKQRKAADLRAQKIDIQEGGDDFSGDMDVLDDNVAAQFRKDLINSHRNPHEAEIILDGILDASIHLVDIAKSYKLKYSSDDSYQGIIAEFCKLDFSLHKNDPSKCKYIDASSRALLNYYLFGSIEFHQRTKFRMRPIVIYSDLLRSSLEPFCFPQIPCFVSLFKIPRTAK